MNLQKRLCAVFALASALSLAQAISPPVPRVTVGRTDSPPAVDGRLDDPCWQGAATLTGFVHLDFKDTAAVQTQALLCWDDTALYVGVRCDEPNMKGLKAFVERRDGGVWRDDCVELFLDPGQTRKGFHQIISNAIGTVFDRMIPGTPAWDAQARVATLQESASWNVEFALPFASLGGAPKPGDAWGVNIGRERYAGGDGELSAWSATLAKFDEPGRFGEVVFGQAPVQAQVALPPQFGFGPNPIHITAPAANPPAAEILSTWPATVPRTWPAAKASVTRLENGHPNRWLATMQVLDGSETYLVISAPAGPDPAYRQVFPITLAPQPKVDLLARHVIALESRSTGSATPFAADIDERVAEAKASLADFIAANLERDTPLIGDAWARQAGTHNALLAELTGFAYVLWTQSPWLDVGRRKMPQSLNQTPLIAMQACLNEVESAVLAISNLSDNSLEGRLKLSDLQLVANSTNATTDSPANMVRNGSLTADADGNGLPDAWQRDTLRGVSATLAAEDPATSGLVLSGDSGGLAVFRQTVPLVPGRSYTLEAVLSADNLVAESATIHVINRGWTWSRGLQPYVPTSAPMRYTAVFTAPESPAFQVVIRLANPRGGVFRVHRINLTEGSADSARFSNSCIRLSEVLFQDLRVGKTVADALPLMNQARHLTVPPGETRQVWLSLQTGHLPPGDYTASLTFTPTNPELPQKSAPIRLNLLPLRLPDTMPIATFNWDYARDESSVRDLVAHRTTSFLMNTHFPPTFDAQGTMQQPVDWSAYDRMLQVKLRHARKHGGIILFSYGIVRDFQRRYGPRHGWTFMDETWQRAFKDYVLEFERHMIQDMGMNHAEFAVQLWDEATGENAQLTLQAGQFLRSFAPAIRTCMDGAQDLAEINALDPVIDLWIPHQNTLYNHRDAEQIRARYRDIMAAGKPVWTYTCSTNMKALDPLDYYRLKEWRVWELGVQGSCYWAYNSWRGDPWNDHDGNIADCGSIYDGPDGPISSRRWEATLEGREDYLYLHQLKTAAAKAPPEEKAQRLQWIDDLVAAVLRNPKDPQAFNAHRQTLLQNLQQQVAANPPAFVTPGQLDRQVHPPTLQAQADRPVTLRVYYRVPGNADWETVSAEPSTQPTVRLPAIPPGRSVQWYALGVDAQGVVCADLSGLNR